MKAKLLALASLASLFFLNGCNCIGDKDTILARIDKEKVYQEDYQLLLKNEGFPKEDKGKFLYDNLYSRAALVSRAVSEYPELEQEWESAYKDLKPRILTMVYQRFYVMECLKYDDESLRQHYDMNRALFDSDSTAGFYSVRGNVAESYYVSKNQEKWQAYLAENLSKGSKDTLVLQKRFAGEYREHLRDSISTLVRENKNIVVNEIPKPEPKAYYDSHKDAFMTVPGYELYHIQGTNKDALASLFETTPSLDVFKQKAAAVSQNALTAKDSGYVGVVKQDFALPYDIGMVPNLSQELKDREAGYVTPVLQDSKGLFHLFYLAAQVPSKLKPFERVQAGIVAGIKSGEYFDVDSSFVLISKNGKPLFTEKDLLRFNEEYARTRLNKFSHDRMVRMWTEFLNYEDLAEKDRLNHSWEFRAIVRDTRWDYIVKNYSLKARNVKQLTESIVPENLYKYEYYMGYRLSTFGKSLEQSVPETFSRIRSEYNKNWIGRKSAEAYEAATVHIYNMDTPEYKPELVADVLLKKADSLFKANNRSAAIETYRKLQMAYADVDSLLEKATYEMALAQSENEDFKSAEAGYYAFYSIWPESPNAEKAMFSRGFILNENLGMNTRAQVVLEEFLQKYPNSELKESAQWLVDNIKSNGKLADDLMKKIEAEE